MLFAADAWATVTFTAAEVRDPKRYLPRALALGTDLVILLYVLTNVAYLCELPVVATPERCLAPAPTPRRGLPLVSRARRTIASRPRRWRWCGAARAAHHRVLVMLSTFGCANGLILTGARVIYAMAQDGVFFASAARLNRARVPGAALKMQSVWAAC